MKELNLKKDKVQKKALKHWLDNNKIGTCEIITGLGKTFIFLHALYTMPKDNDITHLFLAETNSRFDDLVSDVHKYNEIFKRNVFEDYNLEFHCYQSAYKWKNLKFGLVGADEIHDSLSPAYSRFYFNNEYKALIGLSATVERNTKYEKEGYTKGELLDKICPVIYTYNINEAKKDGTTRKLDIYIIQHKLDDVNKNIKAGNAKKVFYQTEEASYKYWDKEHKKSWFIPDQTLKDLKIRITSTKRSRLLYNLESKIPVVKKLLENIKGKTIVFGNSLSALEKITPNTVSSNNTDAKNKEIRESFDKGEIQVIGSFKKLKQGANLKNLDNSIIMSYYSTEKDLIQRWGRLRDNGKIGNIFILLTMNTQEEVWFEKMFKDINDFNIIWCPNVDYCLKKLKEKS